MKDIMIKLTGRQIGNDIDDRDGQIEFITEGKAYRKDDATYVVYEEDESSGMEGVMTTLRIDSNGRIRMKRFGRDVMMDTVMEFEKGKRFNSLYQTPYGAVEMEVLTNKIVNRIEPDELTGSLYIDYDVALKGISEGRNMLNIELYDQPAAPTSEPC